MGAASKLPLSSPAKGPIAIRPHYIANDLTTIRIKELDVSLAHRDFTARNLDGSQFMSVTGKTLSVALQRVFHDASGLPLFELRKGKGMKRSNAGWSLALPGWREGDVYDDVLSAVFKNFWVHPKLDIKLKNLAPPPHSPATDSAVDLTNTYHENVVLEVRGQDSTRLNTVVVCEGRKIMHIRRESDEFTESVYPHGVGYKPEWEVRVARGVDVCLAVVIVVILAEHRY